MFRIALIICCCSGIAFSQSINIPALKPSVVPFTPVKDQYLSATCWSFSSTSLLESELIRMGKGETDISEMFIARHSMMRKIKRHLQLKGGNFFTPGGQFHDAVWVMKNYGLVPESAYTGKGRGENDHNHGDMDTLLNNIVKYCIDNQITELSNRQVNVVDSILDYYYGTLPAEFVFKGKTYTPRTYCDQYLGLNPDNYLEITSYTHHPFYTRFVLEDKYNWTGDAYWNVSLDDFISITNNALDNGFTVGWDGDVDDPDFHYNEGYASLKNPPVGDQQKARQQAFDSQTTLLDHMMHIVGRVRQNGMTWYYVKNSWGKMSNSAGGFLYMREDYYNMRTVAMIVHKDAIPVAVRKKMGI